VLFRSPPPDPPLPPAIKYPLPAPYPPPVEVIDENIELLPVVPLASAAAPLPPAPTVTE
jgi:hypothetical protein